MHWIFYAVNQSFTCMQKVRTTTSARIYTKRDICWKRENRSILANSLLYFLFGEKIVIKMAANIQNLQRIRLYSISSSFYIPMFSTLCLKNRINIFQKLRLKNMLVLGHTYIPCTYFIVLGFATTTSLSLK